MVDTDRAGLLEKLANVEQFPVSVNSIMRIRDSYWKKIFFQVCQLRINVQFNFYLETTYSIDKTRSWLHRIDSGWYGQ